MSSTEPLPPGYGNLFGEEMSNHFDDETMLTNLNADNIKHLRKKQMTKFISPKKGNTVSVVNVLDVLISHGIYDRKALKHSVIRR